jgi:hypothetical protein
MPSALPQKIIDQIKRAGLPASGTHQFIPSIRTNSRGETEIVKESPKRGPKSRKRGFVDVKGRIWIKDRAHAHVPDHWDVQINDGEEHFRVDLNGDEC